MTVEFNDCEASLINNSNLNAKLVMDFTNNPKPITRVHVGVHIPPQQFLLVFSRGVGYVYWGRRVNSPHL